jgi:energy-coupling factor transport system substrate-specific component
MTAALSAGHPRSGRKHGPAGRSRHGLGIRSGVVVGLVSAVGVMAFAWPFVIRPSGSAGLAHSGDAPWLVLALMPVLILVVVTETTSGRLDAKGIAMMGVLATMGTALRIPGGIAGIEPIFFVFIPASRVFGRAFGFVLGAITMFASALLTAGVGPWLPFQMLGAAWFAYGAGCLPPMKGKAELWMLAAYGALGSLAYGLILDLWFWPFGTEGASNITFVPGDPVVENLRRFLAFHLTTAMGWDAIRAATTATLVLVLGRPALASLRRAHRLAAFDAVATFEPDVAGLEPVIDLSAAERAQRDVGAVGDHAVDAPLPQPGDPLRLVDGPDVDVEADVVAAGDQRLVDEPVPGVDRVVTGIGGPRHGIDRIVDEVDEVAGGHVAEAVDGLEDVEVERRDRRLDP